MLEETHNVTMILNSNFDCSLDDKQTNQQMIYNEFYNIYLIHAHTCIKYVTVKVQKNSREYRSKSTIQYNTNNISLCLFLYDDHYSSYV